MPSFNKTITKFPTCLTEEKSEQNDNIQSEERLKHLLNEKTVELQNLEREYKDLSFFRLDIIAFKVNLKSTPAKFA
jgi:hypothetical protein